jgi:hypothetical protein
MRNGQNDVLDLRNQSQDCFEELAAEVRDNRCENKIIDVPDGENPDEIDKFTRNEMMPLDSTKVAPGYREWYISRCALPVS